VLIPRLREQQVWNGCGLLLSEYTSLSMRVITIVFILGEISQNFNFQKKTVTSTYTYKGFFMKKLIQIPQILKKK
jgi:hypothetical protein